MRKKFMGQRVFACMMSLLLTMGTIGQGTASVYAQEQQESVLGQQEAQDTEQQEAQNTEQQQPEAAASETQAAPETAGADAAESEAAKETQEKETEEKSSPAGSEAETGASSETSTASSSENSTESEAPAEKTEKTVSIKITFIIGEGEGTLSNTEFVLSENDEVKPVKATPADGFVFAGWTKTGDESFSEADSEFIPAKESAEYVAHFAAAETEPEEDEPAYNAAPIDGSASSDGVTVYVSAPEGSFPEGTTLSILPMEQSETEALVSDLDASAAVAFDITFRDADGNKVQPQNGKNVSVTFAVSGSSDLTVEDGEAGELQVIHVGDDGKEQLGSTAASENGSGTEISVNAGSFSPFVAVLREPSRAPGAAKVVDINITDFRIENLSHQAVNRVFYNDSFYLAMDWDASANGMDLHEGDYFDVTLPDNMRFPSETTAREFVLTNKDEEGNVVVIARASVTPDTGDVGGTVHVEFTDAVEGKYNVKGTMYLGAKFNIDQSDIGKENTFTITVNGEHDGHTTTATTGVEVFGPKDLVDEYVAKWGQANIQGGETKEGEARWIARINHKKAHLTNVIITDSLSGGDGTGTEKYIRDSFTLRRVVMDEKGNVTDWGTPVDISSMLTIAPDGRSFTLNLGNVNGEQYRLEYVSTYVPGTVLKNGMSMTSTEYEGGFNSSYQSAESGGTGSGDLANKIQIKKVDASNDQIVLAGAVFEVTAPDGSTFTLTTDASGVVTSGNLVQGRYKVVEITAPAGYKLNDTEYELTVSSSGGAIETITNERITVDITVVKAWEDSDNQDGKRPDSVTVQLQRDGDAVGDPVTLSDANNWTYQFTDLPEYDVNGVKYNYSVSENPVDGYEPTIAGDVENGFTITNKHTPETVNINGSKTWDDNDDQDGVRPRSITIRLSDGESEQVKTVTVDDNWEWSFDNLPKYKNGQEITYTITEDTVADYTSSVNGYDVTNSHTPATININGSKTWDDNENQDGVRPASITIRLSDGENEQVKTVTADDDWEWSFENLPKYRNGQEITYSITEDAVEGYTSSVNGYDVTNVHTPGKTSVSVTKAWDDNDDQDGKRPSEIIIHLYADGEDTGKTLTLNEANNWFGSFTELDEYKNGAKIQYTVQEEAVTDYTTEITGDPASGYVVRNTHVPETMDINGSKTWDDNDNQDGIRPETITIRLLANGTEVASVEVNADSDWSWEFNNLPKYESGNEILYTITEDVVADYTAEVENFDVTNTHTPGKTSITVTKSWDDNNNQDGVRPEKVVIHLLADGEDTGKTLELSAENNWTGSFDDLDEKKDGQKIVYTVSEEVVAGYEEPVVSGDATTGFVVTNTHNPETVEVSGNKTWDDSDNQDGARPESITIRLLADGVEKDQKTVTAEDNWSWNFSNLPKYKEGVEIKYTITEDAVPGYTTSIDGYDVTNQYTPGKTSVTVTKAWNDKGNKDGLRPDSVTIHLIADGVDTGKTLVLNEGSKWTGTFSDLDEKSNGKTIVYTVKEDEVPGYTTTITGDQTKGYVVTNTHTPEKTPTPTPPGNPPRNRKPGTTNNPKTGDGSNLMLWVSIMAASLLFLALDLVYLRKKRERDS